MVQPLTSSTYRIAEPSNSAHKPCKTETLGKIFFEKIEIPKGENLAGKDLKGSVSITRDDHHTGWLHVLIYIGQLINTFIFRTKTNNINLVHGQVILGVDEPKNRLVLAHSVIRGIKTSAEEQTKDKEITSVIVYRPIDGKLRGLFEKYAKQTAVNFKEQRKLDPKAPDFKARFKSEVGQFSVVDMVSSAFHRQIVQPLEFQQKQAALAAADLLREQKFHNEKGDALASFYCIGYMMILTQATALIHALTDDEQNNLKGKNREEIANALLERIKNRSKGDAVAATYWENDFMQTDARFTASYFAGDLFDKASLPVNQSVPPAEAT